jgi:hypothetical protein
LSPSPATFLHFITRLKSRAGPKTRSLLSLRTCRY